MTQPLWPCRADKASAKAVRLVARTAICGDARSGMGMGMGMGMDKGGGEMRHLNGWSWLVALSIAYPALLFVAINRDAVLHAGGIGAVALGTVVLALAVGWGAGRLSGRRRVLAVLAAIGFALAFLYGPLNSLLIELSDSLIFRRYNRLFLAVVAGMLMLFFLLRRAPRASLIVWGLTFGSVLVLLAIRNGPGTLPAPVMAGKGRPNIYYFVLDAHPGTRIDMGLADADKQAFAAFLTATGFQAMEAGRSNYIQTRQAMEAITGLGYIDPRRVAASELNFHYPYSAQKAEPPALNRQLAEAGYAIHDMYGAGYGCQVRYSTCHYPANHLTLAGMAGEIANYSLLKLWKSFARALNSLDALAEAAEVQPRLIAGRQPFFLLIHHIAPHPPYLYDSACRRGMTAQTARAASEWGPDRLPVFRNETRCLNRDVARTVGGMIARDPGAIVVLQSDHGPWFRMYDHRDKPIRAWPMDAVAERLAYLNQVRLPAACRPFVNPALAQVNTARLVVACARGEKPDFLPERSFLTSYSANDHVELPPQPVR